MNSSLSSRRTVRESLKAYTRALPVICRVSTASPLTAPPSQRHPALPAPNLNIRPTHSNLDASTELALCRPAHCCHADCRPTHWELPCFYWRHPCARKPFFPRISANGRQPMLPSPPP